MEPHNLQCLILKFDDTRLNIYRLQSSDVSTEPPHCVEVSSTAQGHIATSADCSAHWLFREILGTWQEEEMCLSRVGWRHGRGLKQPLLERLQPTDQNLVELHMN